MASSSNSVLFWVETHGTLKQKNICSFFYRKEILHAEKNKIRGSIPDEITTLDNIREIWVHDNYITGEIPQNVGNMKNLGENFNSVPTCILSDI